MKKTAIVLFNFGGPSTLKEVRPFLFRLFSDPAVLVGLWAPVRILLALIITLVKGKSSVETYRLIGGGSPQLHWTETQAKQLASLVGAEYFLPQVNKKISSDKNFILTIALRTSEPSIATTLKCLKDWEAEKLIYLPLFPQFSTTTTGSCLHEAHRILDKLNYHPEITEIKNWPNQKNYIEYFKELISEKLASFKHEKPHVLFSAHSLPLKIVNRGDPYAGDIAKTVEALTQGFDFKDATWSLAYQSRNGKQPWLEPYTEDALKNLGESGKKSVVVVPVSFISDHIETLYEIDILYADLAKKHGIENYSRVNSFNGDLKFSKVLQSIVEPYL